MGESTFKKMWKAAQKELAVNPPGDFPIYEDGEYVMDLVGAERGESKKGRHQLVYEYSIVDGPADKGETYRAYDGLETEQNLFWVQVTLGKLGISPMPESEEDLDAALLELVSRKPRYKTKLVTKGKFQNLRVLAKLNADGTPATPEDSEVEVVEEE